MDHPPSAEVTTKPSYYISSVVIVFLTPALGGFLFGFDIAATSFVLVALPSVSSFIQGIIVSAASLGAFLASLWIFQAADRIGRLAELRYGASLYIIGVIGEVAAGFGLSTTTHTEFYLVLLTLSRLIYGFGIAFAMHGGPTYIAEMSPTELRGFLVSMKEASIVLGILVGYIVGFASSGERLAVALTYSVGLLPAAVMLGLTFVIPASCRWLMMVGRNEESLESMGFVFRDERVSQEFDAMVRQVGTATSSSHVSEIAEADESENDSETGDEQRNEETLLSPSMRAPLITGIGLVVLQQITGQPSILSYATPIFQKVGLSDSASIVVASFKLIATIVAASTVEQYGRKVLLYIGNSLMLLALVALAAPITILPISSSWIILLSMFVYIGGYQISFGPITWLMISEVFPLTVRGQAVALSVQMNFLLNALVQFIVPVLEKSIGLRSLFGIFAALTVGR